MISETYQHTLWTGSGSNKARLIFQNDANVEIELKKHWMASGSYNYRLYGDHKSLSDSYGWIHIQRVEAFPSLATQLEPHQEIIHIEALGVDLIYEYVKVASSPVFQHPQQDLTMMASLGYAGWNESFDLLLITNPFLLEAFEALKYSISNDTITEVYPAESLEHINNSLLNHLESLLLVLDRMKFIRVEINVSS